MACRRCYLSINTLHQFCCPAPLYHTQLTVPATHSEYRSSLETRSSISTDPLRGKDEEHVENIVVFLYKSPN
ncbi:unnamed protein product [Caretta caretta]